jgi:hypothetical protein
MPGAKRTRSLACKSKKHASKSPRVRRVARHSRTRMVLTVCFALSLVNRACCHHPRQRLRSNHHRVDASIGASGPHDFAVRALRCSSYQLNRVHRIPRPTSVTIAKRPSVQERGTARLMDLIWAKREAIYFCAKGWTGSISLNGFEKFDDWREGPLHQSAWKFSLSAVIPGRCVSTRPEISRDVSHLADDVRS